MLLHYISIKEPRGRHKSPEAARKCRGTAWVRTQLPILEIGFGNKENDTAPAHSSREEGECSQGRQGQDCAWQRTTGFQGSRVCQAQSHTSLSMCTPPRTPPCPPPPHTQMPYFQKSCNLDKFMTNPCSTYMPKTMISTIHRHLSVTWDFQKCIYFFSSSSTNDNTEAKGTNAVPLTKNLFALDESFFCRKDGFW